MTSSYAGFAPTTRCRVCDSAELEEVIDLGETPLANSFLDAEACARARENPALEPRYPLVLLSCGRCALLTLSGVVDPEIMFREYLYVTGASSSLRAHFKAYAAALGERFLAEGDLVVEIGSNDGTLLMALKAGVRAVGVDPAANLAAETRSRGVTTRAEFFSLEVARAIAAEEGPARVVVANNVLAHIDDVHAVMAGLDALLADDGVFVVEAPGSLELLGSGAFDSLYHEHLSVLGLTPLVALAELHGMRVFDMEEHAVHGGSLRVFMDRGRRAPSARVAARLERERLGGLQDAGAWARFRLEVESSLAAIRRTIRETLGARGRVAAYGAPAKSTTLLCAAGLPAGSIDFVCDMNSRKQGRFTPGTHIQVVPPARLVRDMPALCLLLSWNLSEEILAQQHAYLAGGGRMLVPIPRPTLYEGTRGEGTRV